jgi:hypothetical protein
MVFIVANPGSLEFRIVLAEREPPALSYRIFVAPKAQSSYQGSSCHQNVLEQVCSSVLTTDSKTRE